MTLAPAVAVKSIKSAAVDRKDSMDNNSLLELDRILREHKRDDMGVPFAHGAIVALLSAPVKTTPEQMMMALVGNAKSIPGFEANFTACYKEIAEQFEEGSYLPLLSIEKDMSDYTYEDAKGWCMGYLAGLYNYKSADEITREPRLTQLLFSITLLSDPEGFIREMAQGDTSFDQAKQLELLNDSVEILPSAVYSIKAYNRPATKVGRNDPCPCGSGKKYKKCCGK